LARREKVEGNLDLTREKKGDQGTKHPGNFGQRKKRSTEQILNFYPTFALIKTPSTIVIQYTKKGRPGPGEGFQVNFGMQDGEEISVQAHEGESLLDVAWANDIDIEGTKARNLNLSIHFFFVFLGVQNI